jgi:hypothetical protein
MNALLRRKTLVLLGSLTLMLLATEIALTQQRSVLNSIESKPALPNPVLFFTEQEAYQANGKHWTRYKYSVENFSAYPGELFAPAPDLPPCGKNTKSSRSWVDIYDQSGKRLYGFCAFTSPADLNKIWFALEEGVLPPSWVYIEINDRKTNTKYKSNLAETTQ